MKKIPLKMCPKCSSSQKTRLVVKKRMLEAIEDRNRMKEADDAADFLISVNAEKLVRSVRMWVSWRGDREYRLLLKHGKVYGSGRLGRILRKAVVHRVLLNDLLVGAKTKESRVPPSWQKKNVTVMSLKKKSLLLTCLLVAMEMKNKRMDEDGDGTSSSSSSGKLIQLFGAIIADNDVGFNGDGLEEILCRHV